jgi:hypothetical protein
MAWFNKKKEETVDNGIFKKCNDIGRSVVDLAQEVAISDDKSLQMIHLSGREENDKDGAGNCFVVIGSTEGLCEMLFAAGMKEGQMARILMSVGEKLANASAKNAAFKVAILADDEPCDCPVCNPQTQKVSKMTSKTEVFKGLDAEKIANMSEAEMDEFVKKAIDSAKPN